MSEDEEKTITIYVKGEDVTTSENDAEDDSTDVLSDSVKLTPTGKVSHAKTRVYTQRYRKEWESMNDFKDWLTSVPNCATKAFCIYCERNLHAHRLSLLKHMCTMKHQRAAVTYKQVRDRIKSQTMEYSLESEDDNFEELNNESIGEMIVIQDNSDEVKENKSVNQKDKAEKCHDDPLAKAMAHVHGDYSEGEQEHVDLDMVVENENENTESENDGISYEIVGTVSLPTDSQEKVTLVNIEETDVRDKKNQQEDSNLIPQKVKVNKPTILNLSVPVTVPAGKSVSSASQKMVLVTASGKTYTIAKGNSQKILETTSKGKLMDTIKSIPKAVVISKPTISAHVLETSKGVPASGMPVSLYKLIAGRWTFVFESKTNENGKCDDFVENSKLLLSIGRYKLHFDVEKYYSARRTDTIHPFIEIVFDMKNPQGTYHIPLLVSPYSYSTYRNANEWN